MTRASGSRASGIRVRVRRRNLNGDYLICPNDLLRGDGVYAGLDELDRLWLAAGLSCANDYDTTMAEIESWLPSVGRDRHEAIRRRLRERGFLTMTRVKVPAGQPQAGKFAWTFEFFMDPLPPDERDELPAKKPREQRKSTPPMPWGDGHGAELEQVSESAAQPMPWRAGHGRAGHGRPGPGGQGDVYKEERTTSKRTIPPLSVPEPTGEDQLVVDSGGEESTTIKDPAQQLAAYVQWFARNTPWDPIAIAESLSTAMERNLGDLHRCAVALRELADGKHGRTVSPRRLLFPDGAWWKVAQPAKPVRNRKSGARCKVRSHEREPEQGCLMCAADRIAAESETQVTPAARAAGEAAVAAFRERRQRGLPALAPV